MATPELAIAKATLSATFFRADPTSLGRPAVDGFFALLNTTIARCSPPNVKDCRVWIVDNVVPSDARSSAMAKFLVALTKGFVAGDGEKPSAKRRRLHVLYILSDVLHHVAKRNTDKLFVAALDAGLPSLVANAAAFEDCPKHKKKLDDLIDLWQEKQYLPPGLISKLHDALTKGLSSAPPTTDLPSSTSLKLAKEAPYILPSVHGDPAMPWYDLPAATWLAHLTPNSTKPMTPALMKPVQLVSGPADKVVADAVRRLLSDAEVIFTKERKCDDERHLDVNELGEMVELDEITGDVIDGETYYGWSRRFCERMKDRENKSKNWSGLESRSRTRSSSYSRRDRSRSSSPPAFKRRRASPNSRGRSLSRSQSPPPRRRRSRSHRRSPSRSPENSDRRSGRPTHRRSYSRSPTRSRSRSRSRPRHPHRSRSPMSHPNRKHRAPQQFDPQQSFPPAPAPGGFNVPPPPAGYQAPWPPLPPPPAGQGVWFPGQAPPVSGGWPPPPPPPPPPPGGPPQGMGRGNGGGFRGRGRGGYDRGGRGGR